MQISLLVPDMPKANDILPYLHQIDANKHYTNFGPLNNELEWRLKNSLIQPEKSGSNELHITTVSNATVGLELIFAALDLPSKGKALVPALTFPATATALLRQGLTPVFSDVDSETWLMTPMLAKEALRIHPDICLIVVVAAFGLPVDSTQWDDFTVETGIPVVVDAAGAFGNQCIGNNIHLVFSLHSTKSLGGGEGGFIATKNSTLIKKIRTLSNFGIDLSHEGYISIPGTNAKLSEYHAAVTLAALDRWQERRTLRIDLLQYYIQALNNLFEKNQIQIQKDTHHYAHSLLPIYFKYFTDVSIIADYLTRKNIQTRRWYYPLLPNHPAFFNYKKIGELNSASKIINSLLGLPFHLSLQKKEIDYIALCINEVV